LFTVITTFLRTASHRYATIWSICVSHGSVLT